MPFFDIGPLELVTLAIIGFFVFGPDKLPKMISEAVRFLRRIREFSDNAKQEIRSELGPEFADLELEDLNPKTFLRKQIAAHGDDYGRQEIQELGSTLTKDTRAAAAAVRTAHTQALDQTTDGQATPQTPAHTQQPEPLPKAPDNCEQPIHRVSRTS